MQRWPHTGVAALAEIVPIVITLATIAATANTFLFLDIPVPFSRRFGDALRLNVSSAGRTRQTPWCAPLSGWPANGLGGVHRPLLMAAVRVMRAACDDQRVVAQPFRRWRCG